MEKVWDFERLRALLVFPTPAQVVIPGIADHRPCTRVACSSYQVEDPRESRERSAGARMAAQWDAFEVPEGPHVPRSERKSFWLSCR